MHLLTKAPPPWQPNVPADIWQPVVTALASPPPQLPEPPTAAGVSGALAGGRALFATERYDDLGRMLPALLRDVRALEGPKARRLLYQTMQLTVSFLGQVRQYEAAADAAQRTLDASTDTLDGAATVVAQCQPLLRGGHVTEVAELASHERCVHVLQQVWEDAPQWITAQRYAQDIMGRVIEGRRTLTTEMRELADALGTPM
ncbi:hypothetical protein ACHZ98_33335 [Streptomyces sp. MAR4 CNY-716]